MRLLKLLWTWLQVVGAAVAVVAVLWLGAQTLFHVKLLSVQTASMRPTFAPDDALIMRRIDPGQIKPGMIVSYRSARNPNELVTHRVVQAIPDKQSFRTKGDALGTADPAVRGSLLVGQVVTVLPGMGKILNWLRSWPGLIACVYVPVAAIAIQELYKLEQSYVRSRQYQLQRE